MGLWRFNANQKIIKENVVGLKYSLYWVKQTDFLILDIKQIISAQFIAHQKDIQ